MASTRLVCLLASLVVHVASGGRVQAVEVEQLAEQAAEDEQVTEQAAEAEVEDPAATGLDPTDWDAVKGMKKSGIWALVEEREGILKEAVEDMKSRIHKHKKEASSVRRDWNAVKS